jgi:hypothetical protein
MVRFSTGAERKELGWNMITTTPSDFVKEGIERSEAAATQENRCSATGALGEVERS